MSIPRLVTRAQSSSNLISSMKMTALEEITLRPGSKVKIVGLKKFPKYNGQEGVIAEGKDVFWTVSMPTLKGAVVRVRTANLEIINNEENHEEKKFTEKGLRAKEFLIWVTKELAENEPEDPAEFTFDLLKDNLSERQESMMSIKLKDLEKELDKCVAEHKFLEAHNIKEEIKDLKNKGEDIAEIQKQLDAAIKAHDFLLAHDLKERLSRVINTPSKFNYKRWLASLYPVDRAEFLKITKGTERSLEWVTALKTSDLRGAIRDQEAVRRISSSIKDLRVTYG